MYNNQINDEIKRYKYIHVMYNDKFCAPFVEFMNRNFNVRDHLFLVHKMFEMFRIPTASNVVLFANFDDLDFSYNGVKKVIMHSLFIPGCFRYWYSNGDVQGEKAYWLIYGGDLYDAPRDTVADTVRSGFKGYISDTDGDCIVVKEKYNLRNKEYFEAGYAFPITENMIENALKKRVIKDYLQIQINNSSDKSTIDMLKKLEVYKEKNIKVVTVTSYADIEYNDCIINTGKEIFGSKFSVLDRLLTPEEYAKWMSENDILILNQNRQQGLGNSIAALALGVKLYIKSSVTTYTHFNSKGIKVFDTDEIDSESYRTFSNYPENVQGKNMTLAKVFFSDSYLKQCWDPVFQEEI